MPGDKVLPETYLAPECQKVDPNSWLNIHSLYVSLMGHGLLKERRLRSVC